MIIQVEKNSIADELGIAPGDELLSINGRAVRDVFDYRYWIQDEELVLLVRKPDGEEWELEIEKDEDEGLGLVFDSGLMDKPQACKNKCVFCFIDQLPRGLRDTLYFKDDDARLGFLQGNYVTLTNTTDAELDRIIFYHLSPINISVHATDPEIRVRMLNNPAARELPQQLQRLYDAGIEMNYQIVLCKGFNDGAKLDESINALSRYIPRARSLSVVPVGLSRYRERLPSLAPFNAADAEGVLQQVEDWQRRLQSEKSTAFVFAADEFYLLAGREIPPVKVYEGFPQIENGVGMLALFEAEFRAALKRRKRADAAQPVTIITGKAAYPFLCKLIRALTEKFPALDVQVIAVENEFLGPDITVSGLLSGRDILNSLRDRPRRRVLLPRNALRANDSVFLDDMDVSALADALGTAVEPVEVTGHGLLRAVCGRG